MLIYIPDRILKESLWMEAVHLKVKKVFWS